MGGHLLQRKERGVDDEKVPEDTVGEFDFESGLGGFNKEAEFSKLTVTDVPSGSVSDLCPCVVAPVSWKSMDNLVLSKVVIL